MVIPAAGAQAASTHKLDPPRHHPTHWSELHPSHLNQPIPSQFTGPTTTFRSYGRSWA